MSDQNQFDPNQPTSSQPSTLPPIQAEPVATEPAATESTPSYVDAYNPAPSQNYPPTTSVPAPTMSTPTVSNDQNDQDKADAADAQDAADAASRADVATTNPSTDNSQSLEDQNIFELLGVSDATDEEKEAFLDELQQVIWEDFLENDVELLLTSEEMTGLKQAMGDKPSSDPEQQEVIVTYLEKFIPDLEEVMLEKALELKEDMVRERLAGLREFFATQTDKLAQLDRADQLMNDGEWRTAADVMNQLPT